MFKIDLSVNIIKTVMRFERAIGGLGVLVGTDAQQRTT